MGVDFNVQTGVGVATFKLWYTRKGNLNMEILHLPT